MSHTEEQSEYHFTAEGDEAACEIEVAELKDGGWSWSMTLPAEAGWVRDQYDFPDTKANFATACEAQQASLAAAAWVNAAVADRRTYGI